MKGRKTGASAQTGVIAPVVKPERRVNAPKIMNAAEERKRGGKAVKHMGKAEGGKAMCHAGRKPRKSGGRASAESNPYSGARSGTPAPGRSVEPVTMD